MEGNANIASGVSKSGVQIATKISKGYQFYVLEVEIIKKFDLYCTRISKLRMQKVCERRYVFDGGVS